MPMYAVRYEKVTTPLEMDQSVGASLLPALDFNFAESAPTAMDISNKIGFISV